MSAGDMPGILEAWATVSGRILASFCLASVDMAFIEE